MEQIITEKTLLINICKPIDLGNITVMIGLLIESQDMGTIESMGATTWTETTGDRVHPTEKDTIGILLGTTKTGREESTMIHATNRETTRTTTEIITIEDHLPEHFHQETTKNLPTKELEAVEIMGIKPIVAAG